VNDVAVQLSDEDAALAAADGDADLSPEGEELSLQALDLTKVLAASGDEPPAEFTEALTPCFGG